MHPHLLTRCPYLAPQSRRPGDSHSSARPASPGPPTLQDYPPPRPQTPDEEEARTLHPAQRLSPTPDLFVPDLQGFAANAVEDGEEAALERVFEHLARGLLSRAGADLDMGTKW